jgi:general L-amino acid transport system permease protein
MTILAINLVRELRRHPTFSDRQNTAVTLVLGGGLLSLVVWFANWAVINAVWTLPPESTSALCRAMRGDGACWAVINERLRFILFGAYPFDAQWRPAFACALFVALYGISTRRAWWTRWLLVAWIALPAGAILLLAGGVPGLEHVPSEQWGGLPLTFVLSTVGFAAAFPPAIVLALGRRSQLPVARVLSIGYIEVVRGVPLITFLFMASVMFPLFVSPRITIDKLLRAQIAFAVVVAAYVAEVLRGGLAAVPKGQYEAAVSLGLGFWRTTVLVVLPQALRISIPALVNTFVGFFKDTSLVTVIGLFDLLGAAKAVIVDPKWVGFGVEVYLFAAAIYFVFCFAVSQYSQYLERTLEVRSHR